MVTATLADKDRRLRNAVTQQLDLDPTVDASGIGVTTREGAVTLTGSINTYAGKLAAERAVKRVRSLFRNACLDASRINVTVSDGVVCLTGTATSWLQRQAAERAAYDAPGISMVDNQIVVEPAAGIEEGEELP